MKSYRLATMNYTKRDNPNESIWIDPLLSLSEQMWWHRPPPPMSLNINTTLLLTLRVKNLDDTIKIYMLFFNIGMIHQKHTTICFGMEYLFCLYILLILS
jgi:hypothetical protein